MKKIYMILAVFALLSLSLNAQLILNENPLAGKCDTKTPTMITGKDGKTIITAKAPARAAETMTYSYTLPNNNAFSTNGGTATLGDFTWTYSSFTYKGWEATRGMQIGSRNNPTSTFTLSTSEIPGTITSITVGANAYSNNATIRATVGGAAFGSTQNLSSSTNSAGTNTFTGSSSGEIVITWTNANNGRAMYFKSIEVTYEINSDTETATLDVFSDTQDANTCLPVYGGYHDHSQHNQMVYPASLLTDMVGTKIKSMTFYPASVTYSGSTFSGIGFYNGSVTFKLMEVNNSTGFDSSNPSFITGSMTTVKTVNMPSTANTSATTWVISFDQPYEYNGGDLVIDVTNTTGDYRRTYFYTGNTSSLGVAYPGYYTYSGNTGSDAVAVDYIPKVSFTYEFDIEKTATPTITVTPGAEYYTVTATGDGTVTLTVGGQTATGQGSASINVPVTPDDQTLTATATAQEEGKRVSDPATQTVNIPGAGRTPMPTINYVWNGDECTITATGNGEVHMYVDGNEVTQPYVVEKGATQKTIVVTATAQEEGMAISNTATQSIVIPAMNTSDFTELEGTYTADQPIDMSKIMFCDRFSASTATNSHPYQYDYVMKENTGDKRSTNTVEVPVQHTGSKVMPYYSLDSVNADVDRHHVTPYVLNASQEIYMSPSSKIFFYTLQRGRAVNTIPTQYFSVMQRQPSGDYKEMQDPSTNFGQEVAPGDYYNCLDDGKRFTGTYDVDYMAYVPVVWTYGYDRVGYNPDNPVHNSYGAPIWKTGAPQVRTIYLEAQMQRGPLGSTQWEDANGNPCSLYFLGVEAYGDVPSANVTNIKCEPYMFRVWIESPSGKLRGCTFVEADPQRPVKPGEHWEGDGTSYTGPVCVYEGLTTDGHLYNRLQSMEEGNNQSWTEKIKFGAVDNIDDLQVYIRFYYKSDGEAIENPTSNGMRGNRDGGEGYGAGDGGGAPGISTGIKGVYTDADHGEIVSQTYINPQGMTSDKPFNGVNIVITNYSDGSKTTTKVIR